MLWKLFKITALISASTFGGGYVIVPLFRKAFVEDLQWIEDEEMLDLIALAQSSPGVLAINTSILIGYRLKGIKGAVVTLIATALPPLVVIVALYYVYTSAKNNAVVQRWLVGAQVAVVAIIAKVAIDLLKGIYTQHSLAIWITFMATMVLSALLHFHVILIIISMAILGSGLCYLEINYLNKEGR